MRTVEVLQICGSVAAALFSVVAALEHRLIRRLRREGATSAAAAVPLGRARAPTRWALRRLRRAKVVRETGADAIFLEEDGLRRLRRRRARVAAVAVPTAVAIVLVLFLLS